MHIYLVKTGRKALGARIIVSLADFLAIYVNRKLYALEKGLQIFPRFGAGDLFGTSQDGLDIFAPLNYLVEQLEVYVSPHLTPDNIQITLRTTRIGYLTARTGISVGIVSVIALATRSAIGWQIWPLHLALLCGSVTTTFVKNAILTSPQELFNDTFYDSAGMPGNAHKNYLGISPTWMFGDEGTKYDLPKFIPTTGEDFQDFHVDDLIFFYTGGTRISDLNSFLQVLAGFEHQTPVNSPEAEELLQLMCRVNKRVQDPRYAFL